MNETVENTLKLAYENGVLKTLQDLMKLSDKGFIDQTDILDFVNKKIKQLDEEI